MDKLFKQDFLDEFVAPLHRKTSLKHDFDPGYKPDWLNKEQASDLLRHGVEQLARLQDKLYAQNSHAVLIVLQAMDAAGKDSVIKHVMSGLNPQGCQVYSFKAPSEEELDHDYMWRCFRALPERGRIGIFNRSYYEEVLVARVHPEILARQKLPPNLVDKDIWSRRFEEINNFEKYLTNNGIQVIKIFLNVSKEEQKKRFLARIEEPSKNWKFSSSDAAERMHWGDYMDAYEDAFEHTSTGWAPWYIVPADNKWFTRLLVARIVEVRMESLDLHYPSVTSAQRLELEKARALLKQE